MPDNLLDLYLGNNKIAPQEQQSKSLLDTYLGSSDPVTKENISNLPRIIVTPRPPMYTETGNGGQRQFTDEDYAATQKASGNEAEPSAIAKATSAISYPIRNFGSNIADDFKSGIGMATEGLGAFSRNAPAEGVGKVGLGLLSAAVSPISAAVKTAVEEPITQLTGNPDIGKRAGIVAGFGLPVAKAGSVIKSNMPTNKAVSDIVDTIGPQNLASAIQELKSNPRLSLMDVVPATRQMAQKLITTEGQHQNKFEKFVNDRVASGKNATSDIYDTTMGTPVNVVDKVNTLKQAAKDVGANEINPAIKGSGFVDVSKVINNIDAKLKPGVNSVISAGEPLALGDIEKPLAAVRKFIMDDKSVRTDPASLHQFQSALRAKADDLLNSQNGQDRQIGHALMKVRNDIVNAIDEVSPKVKLADGTEVGSYKQALSKYRDEKQVENAFSMGQLVTRNKLGRLEDSPEFWDKWIKGASKEELEAAREGARLAVQHQIAGFKAGARKGQDIVESEFNRDKLSSLFGKEEVDRMAKLLKDERNIAVTNSKLIDNSQTAMRIKADSRVDLPTEKPMGLGAYMAPIAEIAGNLSGVPGTSALVLGGMAAKKAAFKYGTLPLAKAKNSAITDLLTATGENRDALIKILESHLPQPKQSLLSRAQNFALPVLPP